MDLLIFSVCVFVQLVICFVGKILGKKLVLQVEFLLDASLPEVIYLFFYKLTLSL